MYKKPYVMACIIIFTVLYYVADSIRETNFGNITSLSDISIKNNTLEESKYNKEENYGYKRKCEYYNKYQQ